MMDCAAMECAIDASKQALLVFAIGIFILGIFFLIATRKTTFNIYVALTKMIK